MSQCNDEDFGLGFKIGSLLGFIVGFLLAHLMSSTINNEDDKTTRCNCIFSVETEEAK